MMVESASKPDPWRGALAGLAGGLLASAAMDGFQALVAALSPPEPASEPATEKAADGLATALTGEPLAKTARPAAGQAIHYALGAALGAGYGIAAEFQREVTAGFGTGFGVATAALLDEVAVPATGLGEAPWKTPLSTHLYALASHLVFGATVEGSRRLVRAAI